MLERYIHERRRERDVLLMTHIVIGYPDYERSMQMAEAMVEAGADLMELQVPFSDSTRVLDEQGVPGVKALVESLVAASNGDRRIRRPVGIG